MKDGFYLLRDKKALRALNGSAATAISFSAWRDFSSVGDLDRENFQMEHAIFEIFGIIMVFIKNSQQQTCNFTNFNKFKVRI